MANKLWVGGTTGSLNDLNVAGNWKPSGVPTGSDNIFITGHSTYSITASLTSLSTINGKLVVDASYTGSIGSATLSTAGTPQYMEMKPSSAYFAGRGLSFIDAKASTGEFTVTQSASNATGMHGLQMKGSALASLNVYGGDVGFATVQSETGAATNIRVGAGGTLTVGRNVTWSSIRQTGGICNLYSGSTASDIDVDGGTLYAYEDWKGRNVTVNNGKAFLMGSGTLATLVLRDRGYVSTLKSGASRTFPSVKLNGGTFEYDPDSVTVTSFAVPDKPVSLQARSI